MTPSSDRPHEDADPGEMDTLSTPGADPSAQGPPMQDSEGSRAGVPTTNVDPILETQRELPQQAPKPHQAPKQPGDGIGETRAQASSTAQPDPLRRPSSSPAPDDSNYDPLARRPLKLGSLISNRFEIVELIGRGDLASVYRATDRKITGREVALEHFDSPAAARPRFRELFFQEVRAAQNFVSARVVPVRETGAADDGSVYLTMDLVAGESLRELLARDGKLTTRHALEIARQTLLGLQSAHDQGFVHGDVSPECVLLANGVPRSEENPFGISVRLVDFGLTDLARDVTPPAVTKPTSRYLSPEAARGDRIDERADLFAVGAILFECVTGEPFIRGNGVDIERTLATGDMRTRLGSVELPVEIRRLLRRILRSEPARRLQSATEFVAEIEACPSYRPGRGTPTWIRAALVLLGGVAAIQAVWLLRGGLGLGGSPPTAIGSAYASDDDALAKQRARLSANYQQLIATRDERIAELEALVSVVPVQGDETIDPNFPAPGGLPDSEAASETKAYAGPGADVDAPTPDPLTADLIRRLEASTASEQQQRERYNDLNKRFSSLRDENAELSISLEKAFAQVAALELENSRLSAATEPTGRTSRAFDGVVDRIRQGAGAAALAHLESRVRDRGAFPQKGDALDTVRSLARASAALEQAADAESRGESDLQALAQARTHCDEARAGMGTFAEDAAIWLSLPTSDGAQPNRLEAMLVLLDEIDAGITTASANASQRRSRLRKEISDAPFHQPARRAIEFFTEFGHGGLDDYLGEIAPPLEDSMVSHGMLRGDELERSGLVRDWGEFLEGPGSDATGAGAEILRRLYWAQLWYSGEPLPETAHFPAPSELKLSTQPHHDWKARLALQVALAADDAAFPPEPGAISIHDHRTPSGAFFMFDRSPSAPEGEDHANAVVERRLFDSKGLSLGAPQSYRLERRNDRLLAGGQPLIDLRAAGENVQVAAWNDLPLEVLPDVDWTQDLPFQAFLESVRNDPSPCLVVEANSAEFWISPHYGLVRELRNGRFTRRLAFTTLSASR